MNFGYRTPIFYFITFPIDSPRHRFACRPSLQLRWKEGEEFYFFHPLYAKGEERVIHPPAGGDRSGESILSTQGLS